MNGHCISDEDLIAWIDGELEPPQASAAGEHLKRCHVCRQRVSAFEREIDEVGRILDDSVQAPEDQLLNTWLAISRRRVAWERSHRQSNWMRQGVRYAAAAVVVLFMAAPPADSPLATRFANGRDLLHAAARAEHETEWWRPSHRQWEVEFREISPIPRVRRRRLELWSNATADAFAVHWRDESGLLRNAVWRRGTSAAAYAYDARTFAFKEVSESDAESSVVPVLSHDADLDGLERAFLNWLRRTGRHAFAPGTAAAAFAGDDGVSVRTETFDRPDAPSGVRVIASSADGSLEVSADFVTMQSRPKLLRIRFFKDGRVVQSTVREELDEEVSAARVAMAITRMDSVRGGNERGTDLTEGSDPVALRGQTAYAASSAAIEAQYVLHRAGACMQKAVRIVESDNGKILVYRSDGTPDAISTRQANLAEVLDALAAVRQSSSSSDSLTLAGDRFRDIRLHAAALQQTGSAVRTGGHKGEGEIREMTNVIVSDHVAELRALLRSMERDRIDRPLSGQSRLPENGTWQDYAIRVDELSAALSSPALLRDAQQFADLLGRLSVFVDALDAAFRSERVTDTIQKP